MMEDPLNYLAQLEDEPEERHRSNASKKKVKKNSARSETKHKVPREVEKERAKPKMKKRKLEEVEDDEEGDMQGDGRKKKRKQSSVDQFEIRMTPFGRSLRSMAGKIDSGGDVDGKKNRVMFKKKTYAVITKALEERIVNNVRCADLLSKAGGRKGTSLLDYELAALLSNKRPNEWTDEDIERVRLARIKLLPESVEEGFDSEKEPTNDALDSLEQSRSFFKQRRETNARIERLLRERGANAPRRAAMLSGYAEDSRELKIPVRYDQKELDGRMRRRKTRRAAGTRVKLEKNKKDDKKKKNNKKSVKKEARRAASSDESSEEDDLLGF